MQTLVLLLSVVALTGAHLTMPDYRSHPCTRPCQQPVTTCEAGKVPCVDQPVEPMTCHYNFTLEWYHTLSKACYDCPFNLTDCGRPHCVSADGFFRGIVTINRMMPGPAIQVCHNDRIVVNLHNRLESGEVTAIHWHGIHQNMHQYMDGVPMLTQCPIVPNSIFTYNFEASPPGTHYWHAHSGMQRGDGVFGALVVRQPRAADPHQRSNLFDHDSPDHVVIVNDWTHELTIQKFASHHHAGDDNKPKGMLINGLGATVEVEHPNDPLQKVLTPRARFTVDGGKRYRFRLISNAVLNCPIQISVDNHNLLLIASDGKPFSPYPTKSLILYGGERYDFVLNANQTVGNYWFRAAGLADCDDRFNGAAQSAVIHYSTAPDVDPSEPTDYKSMVPDGKVVNPFNTAAAPLSIPVSHLRALPQTDLDPSLTDHVDYTFYFGMDFMRIDNRHFNHPEMYPLRAIRRGMHLYTPQMNNISHEMPSSPLISQARDVNKASFCSEALLFHSVRECAGQYCSCIHRYHVHLDSVVEIILVDEGVTFDASHPVHLHGYSFRVVGMGKIGKDVNVEAVKKLDREGKLARNFDNPPTKDTVIVPDGGYVILRFYADNPGEWFFHCHLLFHSELGMGLVFSVGEPDDLPPVPHYFPRCGNYLSSADKTTGAWISVLFVLIIMWSFQQRHCES